MSQFMGISSLSENIDVLGFVQTPYYMNKGNNRGNLGI